MSSDDFISIFPNLFNVTDNSVILNDGTEKIIEQYKNLIKLHSGVFPDGTPLNILYASYHAYQSLCRNLGYKQEFTI